MVKTTVDLIIGGKPVSISSIASVSFNDCAGSKSDKVTLKMIPEFPRPAPNTKLELIFKSYKNDILIEELNCGLFHTQTTSRIDNKILCISATGVEFNSKQKEKVSHHYKETKLSNIIDIVSKRLGHETKFKTTDPFVKSLLQTNESDVNFLERIAKDYNVLFSIKNDIVYFVNKDDENLPERTIDITKCEKGSPNIKHTTKTYYSSCECSWHDIDEAKTQKVVYGDGTPCYKLKGCYKSQEEAKTKAKAKLLQMNKGTVKGSFSNRGIKLYAGSKVNIINTYNGEDDGLYSVESCNHSWTRSGGWKVSVEIEN